MDTVTTHRVMNSWTLLTMAVVDLIFKQLVRYELLGTECYDRMY